jgi:hypothetical protein
MTTEQWIDLATKVGTPAVLLAAVLLGLYRLAMLFGDRFLTRWERTLDSFDARFGAINAELMAHETRDLERHQRVLEAVHELSTQVEVATAEQRGRRDALEDAPRGRNGSTTR